jgi:hypothetical protein
MNKQMTYLGDGPKIKVVKNFGIFNFAKISKVKFQMDFEIGI